MKTLFNSKKQILLTLSIMFFALMVLVSILNEDGLITVYRVEGELSKLQNDNDKLKIENNHLRLEIKELKTDPLAIEKVAREKLNLVKPGELIYRIVQQPISPN